VPALGPDKENRMNAFQRKELQKAVDKLKPFTTDSLDTPEKRGEAGAAYTALQELVDSTAEEEREKYDNLSEGLQNGATGQKLEENAEALEAIVFDELDENGTEEEWAELFQTAIDEVEGLI
jgi:hypothetical protein